MAPLRSFDAFAKPIDGIRERTISGGLITLIASVAAAILFLSELLVYLQVQTRHSMHLAESVPSALFDQSPSALLLSGHKIPLRVHVTFPHLPCNSLDYAHDGNSHSEGKFQHYHRAPFEFKKRIPTIEEYKTALSPSLPPNPKTDRQQGCTLIGTIQIPRVGGSLSVTVSPTAWRRATSLLSFGVDLLDGPPQPDPFHGKLPNVTHHIHSLTFGPPFPPGIDPLRNAQHVMDNGSGVALANVAVKLVPTTYVSQNPFSSEVETYQASVARHIVQPETLAAQRSTLLPGLMVTYDFTPLAVRHRERREDFLVFLSSLMGIVGGVFVTVGMVTGCLVNSAQAVAKKMD